MEDPEKEIMNATYEALCKHGYAELSIKKIAEESSNSKSNIYYHFDDKKELVLAFLEHMGNHIEKEHETLRECKPEKRLDSLLEMALGVEDDDQWAFRKAFLEMRAQAPQNPEFAEKFREIDDMIMKDIKNMLDQKGVKDPEILAEILFSCIEGSLMRKVSTMDRKGLLEQKNNIKRIVDRNIVDGCEDQ